MTKHQEYIKKMMEHAAKGGSFIFNRGRNAGKTRQQEAVRALLELHNKEKQKMIQAIEMTREDMEEIFAVLPDNIKSKLKGLIERECPDDGIHVLKSFVEQYEADNALDGIISFTCASIISGIATDARAMIKERKKAGDAGIDNMDVAQIVITLLRREADKVEQVLKQDSEKGCCHH